MLSQEIPEGQNEFGSIYKQTSIAKNERHFIFGWEDSSIFPYIAKCDTL